MFRHRIPWILCAIMLVALAPTSATAGQQLASFVFLHSAQNRTAASQPTDLERFEGLSDNEMVDVLQQIASRTTCQWAGPSPTEVGFVDGPFPDLELDSSQKALRRPALPPALLLAGMAAEALQVLDDGTCTRCFFGENADTKRLGFDIRWMVPIPGVPNASYYKGYEDIPLEPGTVIETPPDPDLVVEYTRRIVSDVLSDPSVVIDSHYESGGAVLFYYWFTYDLGDGPRAFFTWDIRVMEVK